MPRLAVDRAACTQCGACRTVCPLRVIDHAADGWPGYVASGEARCILCGHCEAICPVAALSVCDPQLVDWERPRSSGTVAAEELCEYLRRRRSIRFFRPEAVERATIEAIVDIARYAPSGTNSQPVRWLVIHDTAEVRRLTALVVEWMRHVAAGEGGAGEYFNFEGMIRAWEKGRDPICRNAPHLAIACAERRAVTGRVDAHIAMAHFDVVAPSFGVGTCWAGFFQFACEEWAPLGEALNLPAGYDPCYALMFGYPAVSFARPPQRNRQEIVWR